MTKLTICMYGAASDRIDSIYINAAEALGKEIAKRHHKLIYGGGASGLMGACANGVLENGGEVTGVVPTFMNKFEPIKSECTEIVRRNASASDRLYDNGVYEGVSEPDDLQRLPEYDLRAFFRYAYEHDSHGRYGVCAVEKRFFCGKVYEYIRHSYDVFQRRPYTYVSYG